MIVGDKNAVLIATRILGYGKEYTFKYDGIEHTIDLSILDNKDFDSSEMIGGENKFAYTLPHSGNELTFKILNGIDEKKIEREIQGLKRINKDASPDLSTRLKYIITSVEGEEDSKHIRKFVDNALLARDSRALRTRIRDVQPDVELEVILDDGREVVVPIGLNFFWPDI